MYTKHFYERMSESVYNNTKNLSNKKKKQLNKLSKNKLKSDIKNKIAEYNADYGIKYVYADLKENNECLKYVFQKNRVLTVITINFEKEMEKYNLKILNA